MSSRIKVLIADDDPLLARALEEALAEWEGLEVVAIAEDGDAAVRLFAEHRPDVSLLDLSMPHADGLAAMAGIRKIDSSAAVLILSGTGNLRTLVRCFQFGARGCLRKGPDMFHVSAVAAAASHALPTSSGAR
jgi:two-component system response regulator DesR